MTSSDLSTTVSPSAICQIALRLAHKGHKVTVFNRDKSKAEKLRSANSSITLGVANQPSDIGCKCDIALICVKDYEAVSNVSFGKGGLIENPKADSCCHTVQYYCPR